MKSMTGFGYIEAADELCHISVEMKGYNNRYLDLLVNLPPSISPLEPRIRDFLRERVQRGRVEVYCRAKDLDSKSTPILDEELARQYMDSLHRLSALSDLQDPVSLGHLLSLEGVLKIDRQRDPEQYWPLLSSSLADVYSQFDQSRTLEGAATVRDIQVQTARIRDGLKRIEVQAGEIERTIQENIRAKFSEVMGQAIDENRVLAEAAALVVKHSINEEISRIHAHLSLFDDTLGGREAAGKKLDFLSQELNREINTIGSKSFLVSVTQAVISMKDALENIREQLRNLE